MSRFLQCCQVSVDHVCYSTGRVPGVRALLLLGPCACGGGMDTVNVAALIHV